MSTLSDDEKKEAEELFGLLPHAASNGIFLERIDDAFECVKWVESEHAKAKCIGGEFVRLLQATRLDIYTAILSAVSWHNDCTHQQVLKFERALRKFAKTDGLEHGRLIETEPLESLHAVKLMQGRVLVYSSRYVDLEAP